MAYDQSTEKTRAQYVADAATLAQKSLPFGDPAYEQLVNETRADWGEAGVIVACPDYALGRNGIQTDVTDAVANIVHFLRRAGLDPQEIFDAALRTAAGDLEDGDPPKPRPAKFPVEA